MLTGAVNIIVVLGSSSLEATLVKRFANEKTTLGEQIHVVQLDKSDGVAQRHSSFMQHTREACIKEYFFGDARRALSPQIQQVEFDSLTIFRISYSLFSPYRSLPKGSTDQVHRWP